MLQENGIIFNFNEFKKWIKKNGNKIENLNNWHIVNYIYSNKENINIIKQLIGENIDIIKFMNYCLNKGGKYDYIGSVKVPQYQPTISELGKLKKEEGLFLSIAHPNFTFNNNIENFISFLKDYPMIFDGIEINTEASKNWVNDTIKLAKEYNKILTFGSDEHFNGEEKLGNLNPNINGELVNQNIELFLNKIISN